ncbi:MAG: tetratricopeptide repeat protein [Akkermansiaceae bacterium]|nr:tetratricopeptide repeat protein [Akkermansiaceae bacterium]
MIPKLKTKKQMEVKTMVMLTLRVMFSGGLLMGHVQVVAAQNVESGLEVPGQKGDSENPPGLLEQGRNLVKEGKIEEALLPLRKAADEGDLEAEQLCALLLVKLNRPALFDEARTRLGNAARMGSVVALEEQARLALEGGLGQEPDFDLAKKLLEKAIQQPGASESFFLLGKMAAEGLGRERDPALAVSFMRRGEQAGSSSAMFALGQLYLGEGGLVDRDLPQAEKLLEKAYALKNGEAAFYLGMIEEKLRDGEPNWAKAREWFEKAGQLGNASAFKKLGDYALAEQGSKKEDAFGFYQQAAGLKSAEASYTLGLMYEAGRTVPRDQVAAAAWMRIAADRGHALAQNQLGLWLLSGLGVSPNLKEALNLFEKSALQKYPSAQFNTAILLLNGEETVKEQERALGLLKEAGGKGHAEAAAKLAEFCQSGELMKQDVVEAAYWGAIAGRDERFKELAEQTASQLGPEQKKDLERRLQGP